jgi:hypothetical protein
MASHTKRHTIIHRKLKLRKQGPRLDMMRMERTSANSTFTTGEVITPKYCFPPCAIFVSSHFLFPQRAAAATPIMMLWTKDFAATDTKLGLGFLADRNALFRRRPELAS